MIALRVTPEGFSAAAEVMDGNTSDRTIVRGFLERIEASCGHARRVSAMDRGIPTEDALKEMRESGKVIFDLVGTPRGKANNTRKMAEVVEGQSAELVGSGTTDAAAQIETPPAPTSASHGSRRGCAPTRPKRSGCGAGLRRASMGNKRSYAAVQRRTAEVGPICTVLRNSHAAVQRRGAAGKGRAWGDSIRVGSSRRRRRESSFSAVARVSSPSRK